MAFTLTSPDFKDGDYLPQSMILSADFGFGCAGVDYEAPTEVERPITDA